MIEFMNINYELLGTISTIAGGGALGGLISTLINRKEIRRIKKSEAVQSEATAKREDASAASEMMGLLERTVAHMERMNSYNKTNSESLLKIVSEKDNLNDRLIKDIELLQQQRIEDHRRITGLEKTVKRELEWRKDSDYHYCSVINCELRKPPLGTFVRNA